jgi:formamidopyrimidine-DNA glycosylase
MSRISPFRKIKNITDNELKKLYKNIKALTWGSYDYKYAKKMGYIDEQLRLPEDYGREFFVYQEKKDIYGNEISTDELSLTDKKRTIFWVKKIQK